MNTLLGGLSRKRFLAEYWQQRPLLIRGAIPGFVNPISPEELAGLACEAETECRLVLEQDGATPWEVRHGPFAEAEFGTLPNSHWTLLVQEVDRHVPSLASLLDQFAFIPNWRLDDIMVSYAADQGSVGPHVDEYDVFLIQGAGRRRWQISDQRVTGADLIPGLSMRIMREFKPTETWVLEPGDMLYLPPKVPHHGVAQEPCMTYSIGFRAPDQLNLWDSLSAYLQEHHLPVTRYVDPQLQPPDNPGQIPPRVLAKISQLLRTLPLADHMLADWFGRFSTESRSELVSLPLDEPYDAGEVVHLAATQTLYRSETSRFAYIEFSDHTVLYVDGEAYRLAAGLGYLAPKLAGQRRYAPGELTPLLKRKECLALLTQLINAGCVYCHYE